MSLYIGKLSHRTRRDDLERAFARFGRCEVRMKDGFGFVDYDFPTNAGKALRAFEGRTICGERLTISWSNNQPRELSRFVRGGGRSYGAQRGRNLARGGGYGRREDKMNMNRLDNNDRRVGSGDMVQDKEKDNREKHRDLRESLPNEGGCAEPATVDYGRWGDQVRETSNDHKSENKLEFERHEPYHGYERKNGYENSLKAGCSPSRGSPQEKIERVEVGERTLGHSNDSKVKARCYNCGDIGHKKLNCPRGIPSPRKFTRFDCGRNGEMIKEGIGEGNCERYEPNPQGEVQSGKDTSMKSHRKDGEAYGARKPEMLLNSGSPPTREKNGSVWRKEYKGKKRSGNEIRISKEHSSKRARRSVSSPLQSDHTASRSHSVSQSTKSERRNSSSRSRSRSASYRARSLSSNSRWSSKSQRSKSTSPKSRSRYRFHPSLSASVGPSSPSPPNETQLGDATAESGKISITKGELGEGNMGSHGANVNGMVVSVDDENALSSFNMEDDIRKEKGNLGSHSANVNGTAVATNDEKALSSSDTEDDIRKEQSLQRMSGSPVEVANPCTPHLDKGVLSNRSLSSSSLEETGKLPVAGTLAKEHMLSPFKKPDSGASLSSRACNLTSISAEELNKVLKHYGLTLPKQDKRHLSAEDYFGSSRLWPWEIIYYRRLKKGLISNENYARRLAQNREFGIMDKYVRSSSGWGELYQDSTV